MFDFDKTWTLFLDRDGVINIEKENNYINHWNEFWFYPRALKAIAELSHIFGRIIVVTNQKGIGKGITPEANVQQIHQKMLSAVKEFGGHIDAVYYCPDLDDNSPNRKPNPGMAFRAQYEFPDIDFSKSLMVGNNISDLQFGRHAGMKTAFLRTTHPDLVLPYGLADMEAADLWHFSVDVHKVYA